MSIIAQYFIAGIVLTFSLPAFSQDINPNLWQTYINKEFGFRLSYPNDWKMIPQKGPNVRISVSPVRGPGNCKVVARTVADLKGMSQLQLNKEVEAMGIDDASWAEYLDIPQSQFKMTERRRARIGNIPAIYGSFEANIETLEGALLWEKSCSHDLYAGGIVDHHVRCLDIQFTGRASALHRVATILHEDPWVFHIFRPSLTEHATVQSKNCDFHRLVISNV